MNEAVPSSSRFGRQVRSSLLRALPWFGLVRLLESGLSRRGLPTFFFLVAAFLAASCWLRPTLSSDIRSIHIPLGVGLTAEPSAEEILTGPRRFVPASVGVFLLVVIAATVVLVQRRPERLGLAAGVLLCAAMAATAATALNHPVLIELLDLEYEQRRQVAHLIIKSPEKKAMANPHNGRIGGQGAPTQDEQRGDPIRGWTYLLYGQWLMLWAVVGIFFGSRGSLLRRGGLVLLWGTLGFALAGGVCWRRLHAEYFWLQAIDLEGAGEPAAASRALEKAVELFPEFEQLERTWLLGGKLDYLAGRHSPQQRFFLAYQLDRDKEIPRAVAYREDLPWMMKHCSDPRTGLTTTAAGFYGSEKPNAAETGTPYSHERLSSFQGPLVADYRLDLTREPIRGTEILQDLLAENGPNQLAVRNQLARSWTNLGLHLYLDRPILTDSEFSYFTHDRRLSGALNAWRRAADLVPGKRDTAFYLGITQARIYRDRPDQVESEFEPMLADLADRSLRGEILDLLGDVYFEAGWAEEARRRYAASYDVFSLPKRPNIRAQKKLGGL